MNSEDIRPPLDRAVFAVGDRTRNWADVRAAAEAWGDWRRVQAQAAHAEAALAAPIGSGVERRVEELVEEFCRERGLGSAGDTARWLSHWGIPAAAWMRHLRGKALAEAAGTPAGGPPSDGSVWVEGVVSRTLEAVAWRLAQGWAIHRALGGGGVPGTTELDAARREFLRRHVTAEDVEHVLAEHRLDWTTFDLAVIDLPSEGGARELVYCLREDPRAIGELAEEAGAELKRVRTTLEELPGEVGPEFQRARQGDIVGPLALGDAWRVAAVYARREPTPSEAALARRARELLARRAITRETERRVVWLDPLA